ncbi:MAG TPA: DUF1214 domain-containing protein [Candidatus Sulfopaludibacter sp.]|jgi:hypothetical protein|nr:DUF1214 domain-containing protein [Candidatus Sulfopaludibacter sp.]
MSERAYAYFMALIALVCGWVVIRRFFSPASLTLRSALVPGFFVGFGLAVVTIEIVARVKATRVNGWVTIFGCGDPGNGMFMRAACARIFPGPVNSPQEAMYWKTQVDGAGHTLSGEYNYILHFPPDGLPPVDAFWSLTVADAKERFVQNPINRYCVSNRSGLVPNADGSIDIYLQDAVPAGHESNWLPAPTGPFRLWLRAYMPGAAILDGKYPVPPVVQVK